MARSSQLTLIAETLRAPSRLRSISFIVNLIIAPPNMSPSHESIHMKTSLITKGSLPNPRT